MFDVKQTAEKRDPTTKRWKRKIPKKTVSHLYSLANYRFRQFLQHKTQDHGTRVFLVSEANTTKTCSCCGATRQIGAAEVYNCWTCGHRIDRDISASINIILMFLHDNAPRLPQHHSYH